MKPTIEYPITASLEAQPYVQANSLVRSMVEPLMEVLNNGNYYWKGVGLPRNGNTLLAARATYEEQVSIPNGSYLLYLTTDCATPLSGFRFNLYETGSKRNIAIEPVRSTLVAGISVLGASFIYVLPSPEIVTREGQFTVSITNLSAAAQDVGLLLCFAVPKGAKA